MLTQGNRIQSSASVVLALICVYLLGVRCLLLFSYSLDLNGIEFGFVHFSQLLLQGKSLYQDPFQFPFIAVLFTPLYPSLLVVLDKLFGYDYIQDIHSLQVTARIISLCCLAVNGYFIYRIFNSLKLPLFYFLAGFTFYLLFLSGHFYAARPDAFKVTLFTVFLYCALQYLFLSGGVKYAVFAVLSALAAVCFKQDAIPNIYIVLLLAAVYLSNRRVFNLLVGFSALLAVALACCYLAFGKYFFINVFLMNVQGNS